MKRGSLLFIFLNMMLLAVLSGCTSTRTIDAQLASENDPVESLNRSMWQLNWEVLDKHVLRPTTVAYVEYVPGFVRTGLANAANNLEEPSSAINNLLQGKLTNSLASVGRFVINSSFGLLGLVDVAEKVGIQPKKEEFGETLAVWGIGTGPYLMLPALGPTDIRSGSGDLMDSAYFPLADLHSPFNILRVVVGALEGRAQLMEQEQLLYDAVDSYSMVKNIYFQNLNNKVHDGKPPVVENQQEQNDEIDALLEDF
ncbi:MAG: VacJ family lipoprotein [Aestuariibacter sp.]